MSACPCPPTPLAVKPPARATDPPAVSLPTISMVNELPLRKKKSSSLQKERMISHWLGINTAKRITCLYLKKWERACDLLPRKIRKEMKILKEAELSGKRVLLRGDLDVPIKDGEVGEDYRIKALVPTLNYLLENRAQVLIIGHAGRPEGKLNPALSLKPIADWFSKELGEKVGFFEDLRIGESENRASVLENLRFWEGEEENDPKFAQELAELGDLYVNDSFAASHRAHASIAGVPQHLPAYAGLRLAEEVKELGGVLENPERPLVFILGGAKTETKAPLVSNFAEVADSVLLGGLLMFDQSLRKITPAVFPVD